MKQDKELIYKCSKCDDGDADSFCKKPCELRIPLLWDSGLALPSRCIFDGGKAEWKHSKTISHKYGWATKKERRMMK